MIKTWEYLTLPVGSDMDGAATKYLNALGAEGWELIAVEYGVAFMKREVIK